MTAGSRRLGLLVARELGRQGAKLAIVARDEDELSRAKADLLGRGIETITVVSDLVTPEEAERAVNACISAYGRLDVLINNAGLISVGPFETMTKSDFADAWAFTSGRRSTWCRRHSPTCIVNVSSIGGKMGVPHLSAYCASKFALTGFSQAIRAELARENILITTVCPGLMRTGSISNAWFKGQHREEFAWFAVAGSLPLLSIDSGRAARQMVDAVRRGDPEIVITWSAKLAVAGMAVAPDWWRT